MRTISSQCIHRFALHRSTGLFSSAAMQSGTYSIWQAIRNTTAETTFDKFSRASGCTDSPDIVECLVVSA